MGAKLPCPLPGMPLCPHLLLFNNLEAIWTPYFWDFMKTSSHKHNGLLIPFWDLFLSQENRGQGWKFQVSNYGLPFLTTSPHTGAIQEPIKYFLIRAKDTPITQEITRVSRTFCQELGAETNIYIFSIISQLWVLYAPNDIFMILSFHS